LKTARENRIRFRDQEGLEAALLDERFEQTRL